MSAALTYVGEAFALAALDGVEPDALAEAALCAAMCELVAVHGEDRRGRDRRPARRPRPLANFPSAAALAL